MVSGKYSALAGAVSRDQSIANIANNLANANTTGYKRSLLNFESILQDQQQVTDAKGINYTRAGKNYTDFSPGPLRHTENPLDIAIQGDGFFKVLGEDGLLYTRRGDFKVDGDGTLRTSNGMAVLDDAGGEITIPDTDIGSIAVAGNGSIFMLTPDGSKSEVGRLGVVDIDNRQALQREEHTTFSLGVNGQEVPLDDIEVVQGSLEISNVNMTQEMAKMINSYRTFQTYHKVLESYKTIGNEQDELGTLA